MPMKTQVNATVRNKSSGFLMGSPVEIVSALAPMIWVDGISPHKGPPRRIPSNANIATN